MTKIVQVSAYYYPKTGGMQRCVKEISEQLANLGHEVTVLTSSIGLDHPQDYSSNRLKIRYLNGFIFVKTAIIPGLPIRLFQISPESIVHVHTPRPFSTECVWLICKLRNIPYVVHVHGDISSSRFYRFLIPLYKKLFYARALRGADAVIALSNIQADFIKKEYGVQRTVVIPNGVGKEYFTKRKDKKSVMKLLFVGRLAEEKNLPRLLQAFKLMKQKAQLHIVGDGEKFQELQDIIRTKRIKNVILHGKKTGTELISIYREADIFVLTSNYEGQPLTMLEAMAAGLPCIGSNVKGITEFLKDDGVLVSPPTPEEFAKHFDKLVHDKQLRMKYGKKSLAKAKRYTWLSTCQQLLKAYHQCRVQSKENHSRTQYKTDGEKDG